MTTRTPAEGTVDPPLACTYLVPLRTSPGVGLGDLAPYLRALAADVAEVLVVDGSEPADVAAHRRELPTTVSVAPPDERTPMGKVGNVVTGVRRARCDAVVIADDDVRYDLPALRRVVALLDRHEVVRPANWFSPLPWHARLDTGRILLNRVCGGDWPGTLGVRRRVLLEAGGYRGDVLFENLELVRTIIAAGGSEARADDILVRRAPPETRHFLSQRVRQAYDELARPHRLLVSLAVGPSVAAAVATRRWRALGAAGAVVVATAEVGRRRAGGRAVFPATSSLLAPIWVLERAVCSWLALGAWARGGVRYRDGRLRAAASSPRALRRRLSGRPRE